MQPVHGVLVLKQLPCMLDALHIHFEQAEIMVQSAVPREAQQGFPACVCILYADKNGQLGEILGIPVPNEITDTGQQIARLQGLQVQPAGETLHEPGGHFLVGQQAIHIEYDSIDHKVIIKQNLPKKTMKRKLLTNISQSDIVYIEVRYIGLR